MTPKTPVSPRNVWGKVVLYLKERREVALHVACGDIVDVAIDGNNFIINLSDGMMINLLQEGKRKLEEALRWQGLDFNLVINVKKQQLSESEEDIKKLNEVFGNVRITHSNIIWR